MSGFSVEWLRLREAADHRSRNGAIGNALSQTFAARDTIRVLDLGCGTGSNLRALAARLPRRQHWRLVDYDRALLDQAGRLLGDWADSATEGPEGLVLRRDDREIVVERFRADLVHDLDRIFAPAPDLVTAAALFDLVSPAWIERFARAAHDAGAVVCAVLTYDGGSDWQPPHRADAAMKAAFDIHQQGDKGFGSAAGPAASDVLERALAGSGFQVRRGASPWRLGADDAALIAELARGYAAAVRETGLVDGALVDAWHAARRADCRWTVGHTDLLALPAR